MNFESEEEAMKRLGPLYIPVWEHSDETVAAAIRMFREKWQPYSKESKQHNILNLVRELIDPAISKYRAHLPAEHLAYCPLPIGLSNYSDLVQRKDFRYTAGQIHSSLREFLDSGAFKEQDVKFIATQDMLKSLFLICDEKRPKRSRLEPDVYFNTERKTRRCKFCGAPTEFSAFISHWERYGVIDSDEQESSNNIGKISPDLSHTYCLNHRPKLHDGSWNSAYKKAKRSYAQFEQEVLRLRRQVAHPDRPNSNSGDALIDEYFYHFMVDSLLDPTNVAELRELARKMVDSRLTDNKKRILALKKQGISNHQVGLRMGEITGKQLSNQAVSKALGSVRKEFKL